jgi:NADPH-dependent glutamate synthase beta subunit-like oxidoreductase/NAD(P)H-flavin reductase
MTKINNDQMGGTPLSISLGIPGFEYGDLYDPIRLADLSLAFDDYLQETDTALLDEFLSYRESQGDGMAPEVVSDILVRIAPHVGDFIARLFKLESECDAQRKSIRDEIDTVFVYRSQIVAKLKRTFRGADSSTWDQNSIVKSVELLKKVAFPETATDDPERAFARVAVRLLHLSNQLQAEADAESDSRTDADKELSLLTKRLHDHPVASEVFTECLARSSGAEIAAELLDIVQRWSYLASTNALFSTQVKGWLSFKVPEKTDLDNLVKHETEQREGYSVWVGPKHRRRRRDGFSLTDPRMSERQVLYEVDHCIYCHDRDADSCAKGMRRKKDGGFVVNRQGVTITGCPLGEKVSEMQYLKRQGKNIAALAVVIIDNPMCPGTGHRICNDCMKACIYQKTEPVDIPQIETNVFTDVLFMPWGFEIYNLLTRWNPLNVKRPHALPYNGKKILVVGMGPAGYTLSHYLLNEGFAVVGIDALKIERVPKRLTGDMQTLPVPIRTFNKFYEDLDNRLLAGFGGVAEYGITVRWDKNFLRVIHLTLARRKTFRVYGGIRFGGTLTIDDAWDQGFDHIALATGAGKPTIIGMKNNLIRGIRKASDFLMSLQLTGAAKDSSLANLQVRLPAGVIGGGLTAIDTATEVLAYYPRQVEKILHRYEKLIALHGHTKILQAFSDEEKEVLQEFLTHGHAIQTERERARMAGEQPNFAPLVESWGGVTLFYRKGIKDSPAYRQNCEEITEALDESIQLAEGMSPLEAIRGKYGALRAVRFDHLTEMDGKWVSQGDELEVGLRSLFIAAGTSPNTIYEQEHSGTFEMDGKFFQRFEPVRENNKVERVPMDDEWLPKIGKPAPFTSYHKNGKSISFYGDNHPVYAGNVVKAMASAKDGYPYIVELFEKELESADSDTQQDRLQQLTGLFDTLEDQLVARIVEINRLTPTIIEVIVRAPMAASRFSPGQFYRVQNLEWFAKNVEGTLLASEGIALTGAWVDKDQGLISLITLEMGSSSRLCATWNPGDILVVMGVTGTATEIMKDRTVLLVSGGLGNAVQFSIGKALRAAGSRVLYFAGYKSSTDLFKTEEIELASDVIVWSVDKQPGVQAIPTTREQDKSFVGNIIEAMIAYGAGDLGETAIPLDQVDHLIVIGSDRMMAAVKEARHGVLQPYLKPDNTAIASINSPMQCMMKGVCAQCLCRHVDPESGEEYFVYSCNNQDQDLDAVDFDHLNARLGHNSVQEKLSALWLDYLLSRPATTGTVSK